MTEQTRNRCGAQTLFVRERSDHARLVEGGTRARWRIDREDAAFVLRDGPRRLDHHRHDAIAAIAPSGKSLEAVEHFVRAVLAHDHQQRHLWTDIHTHAGRARSQSLIVGMHVLDGHKAHCARVRVDW